MNTLRQLKLLSFSILIALSGSLKAQKESDYYVIESLPLPPDVELEVGALEMLPDGKLAAATRFGDIYIYDNVFAENLEESNYKLFAQGLHEPLGLSYQEGSLFVTQRPEVSRLQDTDGDGVSDVFVTLNDDWGVKGDYHEYAFGSKHDKDGNIWVTLCLTGSSKSDSFLRGWCVRITPDGEMIPTATGIRSPGGIGANPEGDMFYCDNQGHWNGSSSLKHLKVGSFQGNPKGLKWAKDLKKANNLPFEVPEFTHEENMLDALEKNPTFVPPAVIFPHGKIGKSPTGIVWDSSEGKFGPFPEQLFVADQNFSNVQRVYLEKVNGVYQGACFPFVSGFASGNVGVAMSKEGYMFIGGTNRGWGSKGKAPFALERLRWTGKTPFEIHEIRAQADGFELTFTQAIDKAIAEDLASYELKAWTYTYDGSYGSPEIDESVPKVLSVDVSEDRKSAKLVIDGLVKGHVHQISCDALRSDTDEPLLHAIAYYTLNEIPE